MGKIWLLGLAALGLVAGCTNSDSSDESTHTVTLQHDDRFHPGDLRIDVGDTVRWEHMDGDEEHSVTSGEPDTEQAGEVFDQDLEEEGDEFLFTFTQAGSFDYFCRYHYEDGMVGTVTVGGGAAADDEADDDAEGIDDDDGDRTDY